jgi:hypothetical protein
VRARPGREPEPPLTEEQKRQFRLEYSRAEQRVIAAKRRDDPDNPKPTATQKEIAKELHMSEVTLRKRRRQTSL